MKKTLIAVVLCGISGYAYAGELNCTVATSTLPSTYTWSEAGVENAGHCSST